MEQSLQRMVERGILPLTSECNTACLFCSHRFNPPGLQISRQGALGLASLTEVLPTIRRLSSLTIGESVTTTLEGEPLTHPQFLECLQLIRQSAPNTCLRITTNGIRLTGELLQALRLLQPLELTISLNSTNPAARRQLMGSTAGDIRPLLPLLVASGLSWEASLVAMPQVVGISDVLKTVEMAAEFAARTIRVFWPGFTKLTPVELRLPADLKRQTEALLHQWAEQHPTPLQIEPIQLDNLQAEVVGAIVDSPAGLAGVRRGDVIRAINGQPVRSRSDAFTQAFELPSPQLTLEQAGVARLVSLVKPAQASSGLVMYSDLSLGSLSRLQRHCRRHSGRVVILTSTLAVGLLRAALADPRFAHATVLAVENETFGGSIGCAGLLTVDDFARALAAVQSKPDLVLLPSAPFDQQGQDLLGVNYRQLADYCRHLAIV